MPIAKIKEKIFLGDQFSKNNINADKELKMSNIYFNILSSQQEKKYNKIKILLWLKIRWV